MNLKKILINLLMIMFSFSSIAEEKVLKDQNTFEEIKKLYTKIPEKFISRNISTLRFKNT